MAGRVRLTIPRSLTRRLQQKLPHLRQIREANGCRLALSNRVAVAYAKLHGLEDRGLVLGFTPRGRENVAVLRGPETEKLLAEGEWLLPLTTV